MAKKKSTLANRYNKSYETKDTGSRMGVMDWRQVDREIKFYEPKEGRCRINIIPYEIKSKNHPLVKSGDAQIGELDYKLDLWVHKFIGPAQADVVCLKRTYGKPCPICEQADKYKKDGKQKEYDALKSSRRVFYNIQDVKKPETLQVFEVSHFLFEKELIEEARNCNDDGDIIDFADVDDGKMIVFRASEKSFGKNDFLEYKSFQFLDREDAIDEDAEKAAISFDEILKILSYEEIEKILYGADEDEDEKPAKSSKPKDDEDDDPPPKKSKKETSDDDEEEEKPAKGKCPHGGVFGKDCDDMEECDKCDLWDKCVKAHKSMKK